MHDCGVLCTICCINMYAYLCVYIRILVHIIHCTCIRTKYCVYVQCVDVHPVLLLPRGLLLTAMCVSRGEGQRRGRNSWSCLYHCIMGRDKVHHPERFEEVFESILYEVPPRWDQIRRESILCRANEVPIVNRCTSGSSGCE